MALPPNTQLWNWSNGEHQHLSSNNYEWETTVGHQAVVQDNSQYPYMHQAQPQPKFDHRSLEQLPQQRSWDLMGIPSQVKLCSYKHPFHCIQFV